MDAALSPAPGPLVLGLAAGLAVLGAALVSALLAVVSATGPCADVVVQPAPGRTAHAIPAGYRINAPRAPAISGDRHRMAAS